MPNQPSNNYPSLKTHQPKVGLLAQSLDHNLCFCILVFFLQSFCAACRYLHAGGEPRVVEDLHKEWVEGRCRQPPIITYLDQEN